MITLRVEIMTVQWMTEEEIDEPEGWSGWSPERRRQWCQESVSDMLGNYVGTSYDYPEQADDDKREQEAADAVRAFREAVDLPAAVGNCTVCGATDARCRQVIKDSGVSRSCCATCKMTATHPKIERS